MFIEFYKSKLAIFCLKANKRLESFAHILNFYFNLPQFSLIFCDPVLMLQLNYFELFTYKLIFYRSKTKNKWLEISGQAPIAKNG